MAVGSAFLTHAPEALRRISAAFPGGPQEAVDRAERALGRVPWHNEVEVAAWVVSHPFHALVALALMADEPLSLAGARIKEVLPEVWGLSVPTHATTYEHELLDGGRPTPLLDRVLRAEACALRDGPSDDATNTLVATVLLFSDVAKGGTPQQRDTWRTRLGVDGTVHNEDSAVIFEDVVRRVLGKAPLSEDGRWSERARVLCAASGLVGMRLRGEIGRDALAPFVDFVMQEPDGGELMGRAFSIVNRCETTAVRRSLWTEALASAFSAEERAIILAPSSRNFSRMGLSERIARMRGGALMQAESIGEVEAALERLGGARHVLESRLVRCRVWYAEPVLGALSLDGAIRLLLLLTGAALIAGVDVAKPWHLDLLALVGGLRDDVGQPRRYPVRLFEALLESTKLEDILSGRLGGPALVSCPATKGGEPALVVEFKPSAEAAALLTLLGVYETKTSAAFHHTLKSLCDLYGLRKDDYDRVHNEAAYLGTMNAARSDKARMLDYAKPGLMIEVGPGGGVVLELMRERFPTARVVGIDASEAVIEALTAKNAARQHGCELIHGDAFKLPELFKRGEVNTVVFCSVLHEIFSYVPWGTPPARFSLGSVLAMVQAAYRTLAPGGRIIVRDGVMPLDEPRVIEIKSPAWVEGLELFAKVYEARTIQLERLSPTRFRLGARDLYEFLTTFTWGPDSFPYEIREQRAVLPRSEYVAKLLEACQAADPEHVAREVTVPADLASYLQADYPKHILPHLSIFDGSGAREVPMSDVNGVWVIEKG